MNESAHSFSFSKEERLTSKKDIKELFADGSFFHIRPLQFKVLQKVSLAQSQILIAVPKRQHKRAVVRNLVKRRIREAYRLNKHLIKESPSYLIAIIYLSPEVLSFAEIEQKLIKGLQRLSQDQFKAK